jgi:hypothetical protein
LANALNRITKEYRTSVDPNDLNGDWIINPELPESEKKYWIVEGDNVRNSTVQEKQVIDAKELTVAKVAKRVELRDAARAWVSSIYDNNRDMFDDIIDAALGIKTAVSPELIILKDRKQEANAYIKNTLAPALQSATTVEAVNAIFFVAADAKNA